MRRGKGFKFLEHTADIYVAAYGGNFAEALENAASAMFETMTDIKDVKPEVEETIEVQGHDKQALLYAWLEELLIRFEVNNMLYSRFHVQKIEERSDGFKLSAKVKGEPFNPAKHSQKVGIKAVTYHRMEIQEKPGETTLKFILDI